MQVINNEEELLTIRGGINITGSYINAIVSAIKLVFDIGKGPGSSMRRGFGRNLC